MFTFHVAFLILCDIVTQTRPMVHGLFSILGPHANKIRINKMHKMHKIHNVKQSICVHLHRSKWKSKNLIKIVVKMGFRISNLHSVIHSFILMMIACNTTYKILQKKRRKKTYQLKGQLVNDIYVNLFRSFQYIFFV